MCNSAVKKSGKTTLAAMIVIYTAAALAPANGEIYILADDLKQSTSRVFKAVWPGIKTEKGRENARGGT